MMKAAPRLRWGVEQRLEFIEFRLFWEGRVNRSDITEYFGVSVPQASNDLTRYQELAPENMRYDVREKRYAVTEDFKPRFITADADEYLTQIRSISDGVMQPEESWLAAMPPADTLRMPHRHIDPDVLKVVSQAVRQGKALEIHYQSMSRPKPLWRWITPHAFAFDGMRWHVRAYCHIQEQFKDFLLPRILETRKLDEPAKKRDDDIIWNETATVALKPHPKLTEDQQAFVARDYGMRKNKLSFEIRLALLYYFLRRLNLDFEEEKRNPREQHVVLANPAGVRKALQRANYVDAV